MPPPVSSPQPHGNMNLIHDLAFFRMKAGTIALRYSRARAGLREGIGHAALPR
jgi:hypothetical protein